MKFAVQTSIFSRRWRHLWKYTPVLEFNTCCFSYDRDCISRCPHAHKAPDITKLSIAIPQRRCNGGHQPNLTQWVSFALSKGVKVLNIKILGLHLEYFVLPDMLFNKDMNHSVEKMHLRNVDFSPHRSLGFAGFVSLKALSLYACNFSDESLEVIVSKCLVLERLVIDTCQGLANVKLSGSNLRLKEFLFHFAVVRPPFYPPGQNVVFEIIDVPSLQMLIYSGDLKKIHLKNLPNLSQVMLVNQKWEIDEAIIGHLRILINEVAQVSVLGTNSSFLQAPPYIEMPKYFMAKELCMRDSQYTMFQNLKFFIWFGQMKSEYDVANLIAFLGNCPPLERCQIDFRQNFWNGFSPVVPVEFKPDFEFVKMDSEQKEVDSARLERLKVVEVVSFSGFEGELALVKMLLQKAVALEKMRVYRGVPPWVMSPCKRVAVLHADSQIESQLPTDFIKEQVSHFPKASSHAQVLFE